MEEKKIKRFNLLQLSLRKTLENDDYASLTWSVRDKYPRIQVFTSKTFKSEDGAVDYDKLIIAPFTYPIIYTLINQLEILANKLDLDKAPVSKIECYNIKFVDGKKTDEIEKQAEIVLARSQEGVINIGVKNTKHDGLYFPLIPDLKWHKFYDKDGTEITSKKILSSLYTLSYVKLLKDTFTDTILRKE